jgi:hypothetical protein
MNFIKKNPTAIYTAIAALLPLVATFGINFDQEKVLGVVSAVLALIVGGAVRKVNLNTTESARQEVPEGYVKQSDVFPQVDYSLPGNDMSGVDHAEGVGL